MDAEPAQRAPRVQRKKPPKDRARGDSRREAAEGPVAHDVADAQTNADRACPRCAVGRTCRMRKTRNRCAAACAMSAAAAAQPRLRILRPAPTKGRGRPDHEPIHASPVRMLPDRDRWSGAVAVSLVGAGG
ncbi:hypothetical protein GCM10010350_73060 [Streptomyces galilaeus]|nr:hypothetical protein GCM10010350_73060 [Streptomyces galilaeus]